MISVHRACNDEQGNFANELYAAEFHNHAGHVLTLEYDPLIGVPFEIEDCDDLEAGVVLRFGDECAGDTHLALNRQRWVGNMAWDSVEMLHSDAVRLAHLLVARDFTPTEWSCEEPWESIAKHTEEASA